jgi:hypothetical protein
MLHTALGDQVGPDDEVTEFLVHTVLLLTSPMA